jgi:hypothetical protein
MTTHLLPHTASHSPARPVSSYSVGSTIRRVTPSPESLSEALSQGYAAHSTPRHHARTQSTKNPRPESVDKSTSVAGGEFKPDRTPRYTRLGSCADGLHRTHNTTPYQWSEANAVLKEQTEHGERAHAPATRAVSSSGDPPSRNRRITPSRIPVPARHAAGRSSKAGALKRRKAGRFSPSKLGAPRQHHTLLSSSSPASPHGNKAIAAAATRGRHAASAGPAMSASPTPAPPPALDDERHRLGEFTLFPTEDPFAPAPHPTVDPTRPAARTDDGPSYFQEGKTHYEHEDDAVTPLPSSPRDAMPPLWKKPARRIGPDGLSPSRTVDTTTTPTKPPLPRHSSVRSVVSTFSTPGRDEMERKRGHADEGPFANAAGVQELAERRRMVSGGNKSVSQRFEASGQKARGKEGRGLCGCLVM